MRKGSKRHKAIIKILRRFPGPIIKHAVGYSCDLDESFKPERPFVLVSNHVTDYDPILVGMTIKPHMYFVASEHIFNKGFLTKILKFFFDPIPFRKGGSDISSVLDIKRRLKDGFSVALFPEGGRNFAGETEKIKSATGKLVKSFGTDLVTFKFEGGYLQSPRWANKMNRGHFTGHIVSLYPAEDIKNMSFEEINSIIKRDISQNDFDYQESNHYLFNGKNRAESIEKAFFVCPKCGKISYLKSKGNIVFCRNCDFEAEYGEDCHLRGNNLPFTRLDEWEKYQTAELEKLVSSEEADYSPFADNDVIFRQTLESGRKKFLGICSVKMDSNNLTVTFNNSGFGGQNKETRIFPVDSIAGMSQCGKKIMVFSSKNERFEIKNKTSCFRKYVALYDTLTRKGI